MIELVVASFAGWRIASLLVAEPGPFDVFKRIRALAGIHEGEPYTDNTLRGALGCVWCASMYTAPVCYAVAEWIAVWPIALIAVAGAAVVIHEYADN